MNCLLPYLVRGEVHSMSEWLQGQKALRAFLVWVSFGIGGEGAGHAVGHLLWDP